MDLEGLVGAGEEPRESRRYQHWNRGFRRAGAGSKALEGSAALGSLEVHEGLALDQRLSKDSADSEALKGKAPAPRLLKGRQRQEASRSPKSWRWTRGPQRAGAGSKALEGLAAPGSLEVLEGLALDTRLSKGRRSPRGFRKAGADSEALKGPAAPGSLEYPLMTKALNLPLPQQGPDPKIV